jgi:hypothetical protein
MRPYHRGAAAIALLGIAFYTLLLPWHLTSQLQRQLLTAGFGADRDIICQSGEADGVAKPPGAPATSCPICKGLAAFQLALIPAPPVVFPPRDVHVSLARHVADDGANAFHIAPRNRGPPSFPA